MQQLISDKNSPAPVDSSSSVDVVEGAITNLHSASKSLSANCTKCCILFKEDPLPSVEDMQPMFAQVDQSVLVFATLYSSLSAQHGATLKSCIRTSICSI